MTGDSPTDAGAGTAGDEDLLSELPPDSPIVSVGTIAAAALLAYLVVGVVLFAPVLSDLRVVRVPVVVSTLTLAPGLLLLFLLWPEARIDGSTTFYVVGLSLLTIMLTGVGLNLVAPALGVARPMRVGPLYVAHVGVGLLLTGLLALRTYVEGGSLTVVDLVPRSLALESITAPLGIVLLAPATVFAVLILDATGQNLPLLAVLATLAVVPVLLAVVDRRWYPVSVLTLSVSVLYHSTLSGTMSFGGQPSVVNVYRLRTWSPGYAADGPTVTSLLQNGIVSPTYAVLADLDIMIQLNVVNPLLVAAIPVVLFYTFQRYTSPYTALLGASLFVFAHPFYILYPQGGRASMPVLFLALVGLAMTDESLRRPHRYGLTMAFALGIVVTHYGTSYFIMFALLGAVVFVKGIAAVDDYLDPAGLRLRDRSTLGVVTFTFWSFFAVATIAWYMYTTGGASFHVLPNQVYKTFVTFASGDFGGGSSAARLQKDYGAASITVSKRLYLVIAGLMLVGLVTECYRAFRGSERSQFPLGYLAVATMLLGMFSSTLLIPGMWGGGRPMMIIFTFNAVFAPIGAQSLYRWCSSAVRRVAGGSAANPTTSGVRRVGHAGFALVLAVLLVLNTGVGAALVIGGVSPSTVPLSEELSESEHPQYRQGQYTVTDVATLTWMVDHRNATEPVHGDTIARGQTDYLRPMIALDTEDPVAFPFDGNKPNGDLILLRRPGIEPGYALVMGHNQALDVATNRTDLWYESLDPVRPELQRRHSIYTTGFSTVYYADDTLSDPVNGSGRP